MMTRAELGRRIKAERKTRRMSRERLAVAAGTNSVTVGQSERGEPTVRLETLERVCRTLDIPFEVLVDGQALTQEAAA